MQRLCLITLSICFLFACGNKKNNNTCDPSWSKENTVVNHWQSEPPTLHPTNEYNANGTFVFHYIHSYLMIVDLKTLELKPDLVKSLPTISTDGLIYEFELKDGITWDDGSPITVEDVIFTFKTNASDLINNPFAKPFLESLINIEAINGSSTKFKFILKKKYILNDYISVFFPIIQRKIYDKNNVLGEYSFAEIIDKEMHPKSKDIFQWVDEMNGPKYGTEVANISGAGPYKLESWEKGQTMVLVKKKNHWSSKQDTSLIQYASFPEKIIFKSITDENAVKIEVNNQAIDVSTVISTKALLDLEKNPEFVKNYHFGYLPALTLTYLIMNCKPDGINHLKLFDDIKVRQAMSYLAPVDEVIKIVYYSKADRLLGPMHPSKKGYNKNLLPIPLDINKANDLLDEAGWKDSDGDNLRDKIINGKKNKFEFKLMYPTDSPVAKDIADLVIESMKKAGINAIPDGMPMSDLVPKATAHDFDMTFFAFGQSALPDDFEQLWGSASWSTNGSNLSGFGNERSDALIDSINIELDWNKRTPMLARFQKMVYDDQPVIFFMAPKRKIIIHKRFGNANMYSERPGVMLNNLKLLCSPVNGTTNIQ